MQYKFTHTCCYFPGKKATLGSYKTTFGFGDAPRV